MSSLVLQQGFVVNAELKQWIRYKRVSYADIARAMHVSPTRVSHLLNDTEATPEVKNRIIIVVNQISQLCDQKAKDIKL